MTDFRAVSDSRKTTKAIDYITTVARRRRNALSVIPGGIIRNGRNVWRTGKADKAAFLVDGCCLFRRA
ncbi:hypothetical protein ACVJBD_004439 [Rhizobium mongolense]